MKKFYLAFLFVFWCGCLLAQPPIRLQDAENQYAIGTQVAYLIDSTAQLTLSQVKTVQFTPSKREIMSFFQDGSAYWFRFTVANQSSTASWIFEHAFVHADYLDLYEFDEKGQLVQHIATGDSRGNSGRPFATIHYAIPLKIKSLTQHTYYLCFAGFTFSNFPFRIWEHNAFYEKEQLNNVFLGLYFGIIVALMLYYFLLFAYTPQRSYLLFAVFMLCSLCLEVLRGNGEFLTRYFLAAGLENRSFGLIASEFCHLLVLLCSFFGLSLYNHISLLKQTHPTLYQVGWGMFAANVVIFLLIVVGVINPYYSLPCQFLPALSLYGYFIPVNIIRIREGHRPSRYLLASSMMFFTGLVVFAGHILGFSTSNEVWITHSLNVVWLTETIFMSLAFAAGIRQEKQAYINQLKANNDALTIKNQEIKEAMLKGQKLERQRVERELHDTLGSVLWSVRASLFGVQATQLTEKQQEGYKKVEELLLRAEKEVRHIAHAQFPVELEKQGGLQPTLQRYIDDLNGLRSTHFVFEAALTDESVLDMKTKFELYTIVRELTTNILKHAQATESRIVLKKEDKALIMSVEDNGRGFDTMRSSKSSGMKNLTHRVQTELKGGLIVVSDTKGTKVTIHWEESAPIAVLSE